MKFNKEILNTMSQEDLKLLRDAILTDDGVFKDIDKRDSDILRPEIIEPKGNFNEAVNSHILSNYPFKTKTDEFIFEQYANGLSSREIESLLMKKRKLDKHDHATICRKINKILAVFGGVK